MLKEKVLRELEFHKGEAVSGQKLADAFGVSRNAVWKCVTALKQEGHRIQTIRKQGYMLETDNNVLSQAGIAASLPESLSGLDVRIYESIDSTNNEAKRILAEGCSHDVLLLANSQTGGRGRQGRSFYSEDGNGLYMSLILHPDAQDVKPVLFTIAAAVAVFRALKHETGQEISLKWINDLYLNDKKIGGVLSEGIFAMETGQMTDLIIGIGININTEELPEQIASVADYLKTESSRNAIAARIVEEFMRIDPAAIDEYLPDYRERSAILNRKVCYQGKTVFAERIDDEGALWIVTEDGKKEKVTGGGITLL